MARAAVNTLDSVDSVSTNMREHTLTLTFDDEKTSLKEIKSPLNQAGYTVPGSRKVAAEP